jgi:hypothetical protein
VTCPMVAAIPGRPSRKPSAGWSGVAAASDDAASGAQVLSDKQGDELAGV